MNPIPFKICKRDKRSRLETIAGMVENLGISFILPSFTSTESLHHVAEKEWEICQAHTIFTCLLFAFPD